MQHIICLADNISMSLFAPNTIGFAHMTMPISPFQPGHAQPLVSLRGTHNPALTTDDLEDLGSALRWGDKIGRLSAHDLFQQYANRQFGFECGLIGYAENSDKWLGRAGDECSMGFLTEREGAAMLVHTHPPKLTQTSKLWALPSSGDVITTRECPATRAVVSADGVYIYDENSRVEEPTYLRRIAHGMTLIPSHDVILINSAGKLLIEPVEGNFIPVVIIE
jgi:hypothetical protein